MPSMKGRVAAAALGCKVNQYEIQMIIEKFEEAGYMNAESGEKADVFIINTCSVTNLSDRKSRQLIRRIIRDNPECVVVATGCYAQMQPGELSKIEGVDLIVGTNNKSEIVELTEEYINSSSKSRKVKINSYDEIAEYEDCGEIEGMVSRTRALIKIQEGCDRFCSYCIIPYARGRARSRNLESIFNEAKGLIDKGYKEIVLAGINTALYGMEKGFVSSDKNSSDPSNTDEIFGVEFVIRKLNEIHGDFRIRLSSLEPTVVDSEYALRLLKYEKLCPHMHLSMQSGSDKILKMMNRNYTREQYIQILNTLKSYDDCFGISTDIIVGFPGESDSDFEDTLNLVRENPFCKIHIFPFSERSGTKACQLPGKVSDELKKKRCDELQLASIESEYQFLKNCIGKTRTVLFEEYDEKSGRCEGYTDNYIKVVCDGNKSLKNSFSNVMLKSVENKSQGIMKGEIVSI